MSGKPAVYRWLGLATFSFLVASCSGIGGETLVTTSSAPPGEAPETVGMSSARLAQLRATCRSWWTRGASLDS